MGKTYSLIVRYDDIIEFQCIISEDAKYFRVFIDKLNYEEMLEELLYKGYIKTIKIKTDNIVLDDGSIYKKEIFKNELITFDTPEQLFHFLNKDFECELKDELQHIFEVIAIGSIYGFKDNIMASSIKHTISMLATLVFKVVNNVAYEPVQHEIAGSYGIEVKDIFVDNNMQEKLNNMIHNIKDNNIDKTLYLENEHYYHLINHLIHLASTKELTALRFKVKEHDITLSKEVLIELKETIKDLYHSRKINISVLHPLAINFDNLTFKLNYKNKIIYCHTSKAILSKINENQDKLITYRGYYLSIKTIYIDTVTIHN